MTDLKPSENERREQHNYLTSRTDMDLREEVIEKLAALVATACNQNSRIATAVRIAADDIIASFRSRELTDEEISTHGERLWHQHSSVKKFFVLFARWAIAKSGSVCGPTADAVYDASLASSSFNINDSRKTFCDWYNTHVKPIAEVEAPLKERITELEAQLADSNRCLNAASHLSQEQYERISDLEVANKAIADRYDNLLALSQLPEWATERDLDTPPSDDTFPQWWELTSVFGTQLFYRDDNGAAGRWFNPDGTKSSYRDWYVWKHLTKLKRLPSEPEVVTAATTTRKGR
jgi:hypothetical protein